MLVDRYYPPHDQLVAPEGEVWTVEEIDGIIQKNTSEFDQLPESLIAEFDPESQLLDTCLTFADEQKNLLGLPELPKSYISDLYTSELLFTSEIIQGLRKLEDARPEEVVVLFDLDRTTVGMGEYGQSSETTYTTRPGLAYLCDFMRKEFDQPPKLGVLSDRKDEDMLKFKVLDDHFSQPGVSELVDDSYILSSTDGTIARQLPAHLRLGRNEGASSRSQTLSELCVESSRYNVIGHIATEADDAIKDTEVEYHTKAAVVAWLAKHNPNTAFLWVDDLNTARLAQSELVRGVHATEHMQVLLPNDVRYLFDLDDFDL